MADKIAGLRILADDAGKDESSAHRCRRLRDRHLAVHALRRRHRGRRPSFLAAAPGPIAEPLYERFIAMLRERGCTVETGVVRRDERSRARERRTDDDLARAMSTPRVILASASPRRRELLALVGIPHVVEPADIDQSYRDGEEAAEHAERLAREKAVTIVARTPDVIVIAADTIVLVDGLVLGKPRDRGDAERMLAMLAGQTHVGSPPWPCAQGERTRSASNRARHLPARSQERAFAPTSRLASRWTRQASYGIQGYGATLVERIDGDYFAVMGLALARMIDLLGELGVGYDFGPLSLRAPA